jgi:hypothetical protein
MKKALISTRIKETVNCAGMNETRVDEKMEETTDYCSRQKDSRAVSPSDPRQ